MLIYVRLPKNVVKKKKKKKNFVIKPNESLFLQKTKKYNKYS